MSPAHHLSVNQRLDATRQHEAPQGGERGDTVLLGKDRRATVLVVDDDGEAVGIDVHPVDRTHKVGTGIFHRCLTPAEAPLEEAWLEAQKEARLIVERREQVLAQLLELAPLLVVMGYADLGARSLALPEVLMLEVKVELVGEDPPRALEALTVALAHA